MFVASYIKSCACYMGGSHFGSDFIFNISEWSAVHHYSPFKAIRMETQSTAYVLIDAMPEARIKNGKQRHEKNTSSHTHTDYSFSPCFFNAYFLYFCFTTKVRTHISSIQTLLPLLIVVKLLFLLYFSSEHQQRPFLAECVLHIRRNVSSKLKNPQGFLWNSYYNLEPIQMGTNKT